MPTGAETGDTVRVAGRIRAMRNSGMFIDLHDASGKIQVFSHKDYLSADGMAPSSVAMSSPPTDMPAMRGSAAMA